MAMLLRAEQPIIPSSDAPPDPRLAGAHPWRPWQKATDATLSLDDRAPTYRAINALRRCAPEGADGG